MADGNSETYDLLTRWRQGDRDALGALLQRDLDWLRRVVHRQLGAGLRRAGDTEDFVQEAALVILTDGPRFVLSNRAEFRAVLAKITINVLRNRHRYLHALRRSPDREQELSGSVVLDLDRPYAPPPDQAAQLAEEREWLRLALLLLDPADQALIELHWQGLDDAEIGAQIGAATSSMRMRRSRATARLARMVRRIKAGQVASVVEDHRE